MTTLSLTPDQLEAKKAFQRFLCSPIETVFVLGGFSGCGKSTLVHTLLDEMDNFLKVARLINPKVNEFEVALTATTNKAAENLQRITQREVVTIQSFLHLMVKVTDYKTYKTELVPRDKYVAEGYLLFVDEGSYIDAPLMKMIFARTKNCKIVFVGDPAQLLNVGCTKPPVFNSGFTGASLTQVVRQAEGNPIVDLATQFRHTVNTGEWPKFQPDGHHVQWLERSAFMDKMLEEFGRPDWKFSDSKVLAWTNKCVIAFNNFVRSKVSGSPHFEEGDYAICNSFVTAGKNSIKTDQLVQISHISAEYHVHDVPGNKFTLDNAFVFFMPKTLELKNARLKEAKAQDDHFVIAEIEESWIDLRAAYSCTVNKAQGSTYDRVFIDLDDISRCNSGDQIARMLYVAVSRARDQVYLTGDIA